MAWPLSSPAGVPMGRAVAASSDIVLGIDLGTSFSTAAALIDGKLQYVLDSRGEACIPSVVHFPKSGAPLVGIEADRMRATDPVNTVFGIKRVIGRDGDSPAARVLDASAPFRLLAKPGAEVAVQVRTGTHTATEVASLILRHLRERASARFNKPVRRALITVPVSTPPAVQAAMMRCGQMAGLEVVRLVHEPVAGAVARGASGAAAPFLVYDFGGGTFDATVVRGDGKGLKVLSAGGDDCLGGDDLDLAFARWVANGIYRSRSVDATRDVLLWNRIQRQCEAVKRALSAAPEVRYLLKDALPGAARDLDVPVRREHLVQPWAELVSRSIESARETVRASGLPDGTLGGVLLIGGTTFVPQVREAVGAAFRSGRIIAEEDPQTAVARGAALLAARPEQLAA
jgi:molecular chaperone DnaK (HSP70)